MIATTPTIASCWQMKRRSIKNCVRAYRERFVPGKVMCS
uniref:Uncharacterized protein n=1 Tax=Anopheles quadriannulatus TaxID=34691 RepID=A0A182XRI2_ANOQN